MIYVYTALYFLVFGTLFYFLCDVYGSFLLMIGRKRRVVKHVAGALSYLLMSALVVSPLLLAYLHMDEAIKTVRKETVLFLFSGLLYGVSMTPGMVMFRKKYIAKLRRVGFFKK